MTAAEWLAAKSRSYRDDAARLAREGGDIDGLTGEQWSLVYRAIAGELNKCAKEATAAGSERIVEMRRDGFGDW